LPVSTFAVCWRAPGLAVRLARKRLASCSFVLHSIVRWTTTLFHRRWRRSPEKVASLDIDACDPVQDIDTRRANASLKRADIGAIEFSTMREFLLRDASHVSQLSQIERQYLSETYPRAPRLEQYFTTEYFRQRHGVAGCPRRVAAFVKRGCELCQIELK
jgi:hypothetical protein